MGADDVPARVHAVLRAVLGSWRTTHKLTPSEEAVAEQVLRGQSNKEVGRALRISTATVRTHVSNVLKKLTINSRAELAFRAFCDSVELAERSVSAPSRPRSARPGT